MKIIRLFFRQFSDDSVKNINKFITYPLRKFVFLHYLRWRGRLNDYNLIKKIRARVPKKEGVYLSREQLKQIVFSIPEERYRMAALIQFATGIRAFEALKAKKEDFEWSGDYLKLRIIGKRNLARNVFIPKIYGEVIWNYIQNAGKYPFLKGESKNFPTWVENNYHYYLKAVKKAAEKLGYPDFATHDFRRNFIDDVCALTQDIRVVRVLAGHKDAKTTLRYLDKHISEEAFKEVIKKMRS